MKKIIFLSLIFFSFSFLFSQENEIELPDVTTVISGNELTAGKDAIPDYSEIEVDFEKAQIEISENPNEKNISDFSDDKKTESKSLFAEGKVGFAFPFIFTSDFAIYKISEFSPFELKLHHSDFEGFGSKKAEDGFFKKNSAIQVQKEFNSTNSKNIFNLEYSMNEDGFQSKSSNFSSMTKHNAKAEYSGSWNFLNGIFLNAQSGIEYFTRYENTFFNDESIAEYEKNSRIFNFSPEFTFGWKNENFRIGLNALYEGSFNLKDKETLLKYENYYSSEAVHRGDFSLFADYLFKNLKLFADAGVVVGSSIGDNKAIFPFGLGFEFLIKEKGLIDILSFKGEGGIKSQNAYLNELEKKNYFAVSSYLPGEESDFFGKGEISIQFKNSLKILADCEFSKTAFGNGKWIVKSENISPTGFYFIERENQTYLNSNLLAEYNLKDFSILLGANNYWLDVPFFEEKTAAFAKISYVQKDLKWNAFVFAKQNFGENADSIPEINVEGEAKISPSCSLVLSGNDLIKLFTNETRKIGNSCYIKQSGNVTFFVKFQF